jgi:tRNA (mo5U34)-methyltransferase
VGTRTFRWRGYGITVSTPPRPAKSASRKGGLVLRSPLPALDVRARDLAKATEFVRIAGDHARDRAVETGWTGDSDLAAQVRSVSWYHSIDLADGTRTPGQFDHHELLPHYGLPEDMSGLRALDVATFDGYWAFEMEQRGADVTAIDLESRRDYDYPPGVQPVVEAAAELPPIGQGFAIAHRARGSSVTRIGTSVYALDPHEVGTFDFVHCGDLLVHLREPLRALERIRAVTTGTLLLSDGVDVDAPSGRWGPTVEYLGGWDDVVWWVPSIDALAQMVIDAGFASVRLNCVYNLAKTHETEGFWRASLTATT